MLCAYHFGWTHDQVETLDPDYADELREAMRAKADHDAAERRKLGQAGRRGEHAGLIVEDAEIPDD